MKGFLFPKTGHLKVERYIDANWAKFVTKKINFKILHICVHYTRIIIAIILNSFIKKPHSSKQIMDNFHQQNITPYLKLLLQLNMTRQH